MSISTNLHLNLMEDGTETGTWGGETNSNLQTIEKAISGVTTIAVSGTGYTLVQTPALEDADPAINAVILLTGTVTAGFTFTIPAISKVYYINNGTTQAVIISCGVGGTQTIGSGAAGVIVCTGSAIISASAPPVGSDASAITSGIFSSDRIPTIANAKLATMATNTIKGNNTGGSVVPIDLTVAETRTLLGLTDANVITIMGGYTLWSGSQGAYDAIVTKDNNTLYFIG